MSIYGELISSLGLLMAPYIIISLVIGPVRSCNTFNSPGSIQHCNNGEHTALQQWGAYSTATMGSIQHCNNGEHTALQQWGAYSTATMGSIQHCNNGEHTALQQCGAIVRTTIVISAPPGTHLHLSEVEHSRVKCIVQEHKIDTTMSQC